MTAMPGLRFLPDTVCRIRLERPAIQVVQEGMERLQPAVAAAMDEERKELRGRARMPREDDLATLSHVAFREYRDRFPVEDQPAVRERAAGESVAVQPHILNLELGVGEVVRELRLMG